MTAAEPAPSAAETVELVADDGGCAVCDAGLVAHTTSDGVTHLCTLHTTEHPLTIEGTDR